MFPYILLALRFAFKSAAALTISYVFPNYYVDIVCKFIVVINCLVTILSPREDYCEATRAPAEPATKLFPVKINTLPPLHEHKMVLLVSYETVLSLRTKIYQKVPELRGHNIVLSHDGFLLDSEDKVCDLLQRSDAIIDVGLSDERLSIQIQQ